MACLIALILCATYPDGGEGRWADVIRDAQLANQQLARQGHYRAKIEYTPGKQAKINELITIEADVTWSDTLYFEKIRAVDPTGLVVQQLTTGPLDSEPWLLLLQSADRLYTYQPVVKVAVFNKAGVKPFPAQHLYPRAVWFSCCPPGEGRPWPELLAPLPATATGDKPGTVEFVQLPDQVVREIRRDPDIGVFEIDYSMKAAGNPIASKYTLADGTIESRGTWQWKQLGDAWVLDSIDYAKSSPVKHGDLSITYKLKVLDIDLKPVSPTVFTRQYFLNVIPADARVEDAETGRVVRAPNHPQNMDSQLDKLEKDLKSGGFAQP